MAVIFGALGFLAGRITGHDGHHRMMKLHGNNMEEYNINVEVDEESKGLVKVDTIMKERKQIIIKKIKKIEKN